MINNKKVVVVLPAYNAAKTLEITYKEIDFDIVDDVILVDDLSKDDTVKVGKKLGIKHIVEHEQNKGYGGNQKTFYNKALELGAEIIIMLHPDYQYTPKLIPAMAHLLDSGLYHVVLGSRILGKGALKGGMPVIKYIANRGLTFIQNILMNGGNMTWNPWCCVTETILPLLCGAREMKSSNEQIRKLLKLPTCLPIVFGKSIHQGR